MHTRYHAKHLLTVASERSGFASFPNQLALPATSPWAQPSAGGYPATYTQQPARPVPAGPAAWQKIHQPFRQADRGHPGFEEQAKHGREARRRAGHDNSGMALARQRRSQQAISRRAARPRCCEDRRSLEDPAAAAIAQLSKECQRRGFNLEWLPQPAPRGKVRYDVRLLHHVVETDVVSDCECSARAAIAPRALSIIRTWPMINYRRADETNASAARPIPQLLQSTDSYRPVYSYKPGPLLLPKLRKAQDTPTTKQDGDVTARGGLDERAWEETALLNHVRRVMGISPPESSTDTPASRAFLDGLAAGARFARASLAELSSRGRSRSPSLRLGRGPHRRRSPLREPESPALPRLRQLAPGPNSDQSGAPPLRLSPALRDRSLLEPERLTPPSGYQRPMRDYSDLYETWHPGNSDEVEGKWLHDRYQSDERGRRN